MPADRHIACARRGLERLLLCPNPRASFAITNIALGSVDPVDMGGMGTPKDDAISLTIASFECAISKRQAAHNRFDPLDAVTGWRGLTVEIVEYSPPI
jgi:hypothetical protein